ncbi:MAG: hypothetical protein IH619_03430 [Ignavibacterium sp.]|nr:hypothetical protein [Ignavibacterium sp.]
MDIKNEIHTLIVNQIESKGKRPTKLYVTDEKEEDFIFLNPYPNISLSPREAFKNGIFGLKIIWNAEVFKVE